MSPHWALAALHAPATCGPVPASHRPMSPARTPPSHSPPPSALKGNFCDVIALLFTVPFLSRQDSTRPSTEPPYCLMSDPAIRVPPAKTESRLLPPPPVTPSNELLFPSFPSIFPSRLAPPRLPGAAGSLRHRRRPSSDAVVNENLTVPPLFLPCGHPDALVSPRHSPRARRHHHDATMLNPSEDMHRSHPPTVGRCVVAPTLQAVTAMGAHPCYAVWSGQPDHFGRWAELVPRGHGPNSANALFLIFLIFFSGLTIP
jgi:hypothetical protein